VSTVPAFISLLQAHGSDVEYSRVDSFTLCPCRTPEGFRDPLWHDMNPGEAVCNEAGMLSSSNDTVNLPVKAFVQPIQSTRATRLQTEYFVQMFGEVQTDDHLGIFPCDWEGWELNFFDWPQVGTSFILYQNRKFIVVNANLIPDPDDGNPKHHWELGLRLMSERQFPNG
jgi:hypothetical protein